MNIIEHPRLYRLLGSASDLYQTQWKDIEQQVWDMFGKKATILVTDMSHFSQVTNELGIVYYLGMIKKMQDIIAMSVSRHQGQVIKFAADNSFSIFETVDQAIAAIIEVNQKMSLENRNSVESRDIKICAGIDYGDFLNINDKDLYGACVNFASLLGEDTAKPWEILVSDKACNLVKNTQYQFTSQKLLNNDNQFCYRKLSN
jgi:class 3 adenylate cyclase